MAYSFNRSRPAWQFKTSRFTVALYLERDRGYRYDGDDQDGETQDKLDSGEYVAFDSSVIVTCDGREIGRDDLGGSVYAADEVPDFFTAHRDPDPNNRNTLAMAARNTVICHYFPEMVRNAIREARESIRASRAAVEALPRVRESAK